MTQARALKRGAGALLRACTRPLVRLRPIEECPGWLATLHNLHHYLDLMKRMRAAIEAGAFEAFRAAFHAARDPGQPENGDS